MRLIKNFIVVVIATQFLALGNSVRAEYFVSIRDSYVNALNNNIALIANDGTVLNPNFVDPLLLQGPTGLAVVGNSLYVANAFSNTITEFNATTGALVGIVADATDGLNGPGALRYRDGSLYVANLGSPLAQIFGTDVLKINTTTGVATQFISSGLVGPAGLLFDPSGNLYVSELATNEVTLFDTAGAPIGGPLTNALLSGPTGMEFDPNGDLLIAAVTGARVVKYDGDYSTYADVAFLSSFPSGVLYTGPDTFWIFDSAYAGLFNYQIIAGVPTFT
jgi:DNA-binding beta-propeller fold protein YncE